MAGSREVLDQTAEADRALWPREGKCPSSESSAEPQEWLKHGDDMMGFGFSKTLLEEASADVYMQCEPITTCLPGLGWLSPSTLDVSVIFFNNEPVLLLLSGKKY